MEMLRPVGSAMGLKDRLLPQRTVMIARKACTGGMEVDCSRPTCLSQSAKRSLPSFCAFENFARDVPTSLMSIIAVRQKLTCPFERNFYIGYHSRTKAVRDHDNPSVSDGRIMSAKGKTER